MIRLRINNFIKKHKDKIYDLVQKLIMVAMIVLIATIVMSSLTSFESNNNLCNCLAADRVKPICCDYQYQ